MSQLKVDDIVDAAGTGAPTFSNGVTSFTPLTTGSDADTVLTTTSSRFIKVTPTATRTYTLPGVGVKAGDMFNIMNLAAASSGFNVVIAAADASTVRTVYPQGSTGTVMALVNDPADSGDWEGIGQITSPWNEFSVSWSNMTTSSDNAAWRREGQNARITVLSLVTSVTGEIRFNTPTGLDFDNTITAFTGSNNILGNCYPIDTGTTREIGMCNFANATQLRFFPDDAAGSFNTTTPFTWASGDEMGFTVVYPVSGWTETKG